MQKGYLGIRHPAGTCAPQPGLLRGGIAGKLGFRECYAPLPGGTASGGTGSDDTGLLCAVSPRDPPRDDQGTPLRQCRSADDVENAVQMGQGVFSVSWAEDETLARHRAAHVRASTHAGRRARRCDWRVARTVLVHPDGARAEAMVMDPDGPCYAYYRQASAAGTDIPALLRACVLFGSPDTVRDRLEALCKDAPFGTLALIDHDWPDTAAARLSLGLFAGLVLPKTQAPVRHNQGKLEHA